MWTLIGIGVLTLIILNYALWGRELLKAQPWAHGFFAWIEPFEIALYKKSETILKARTLQVLGILLSGLTAISNTDLTIFVPLLPDGWGWIVVLFPMVPLLISVLGWMDEKLRNETTKPLEIVALPENKPLPEAVAETVVAAEAAKEVAVAAIKEAKLP